MAFWRVTLLFNFTKTPACGFSERYDIEADTTAEARACACTISAARLTFMAEDWELVAVRLSSLTIGVGAQAGKIVQRNVFLCPNCTLGTGGLGSADIPAGAIFADFKYTILPHVTHRQFRGIPDDWWDGAALTQGNAAVQNFCRALKICKNRRVYIEGPGLVGQPLDCCMLRRISSRRVGRPFGLLRGRRFSHREATA